MKTHTESFVVAWSECDAAGKVFYPNFYFWFDRSTEKLFRANRLSFAELARDFGIVGMPLLESGAEYHNICPHGAELSIESRVDEWAGKTFTVRHRVMHKDGRPAASGREKRIFVVADTSRPSGIRGIEPPAEVVARLS